MATDDPRPVHAHRVEVRFGDCDPAGIIYFPRFFDLFHQAMETWFGGPLESPYDEVIIIEKIGFPAVHTEADFRAPTRFGETLIIELRVGRVGRSSIQFDYLARAPDEETPRVTGATICAVIDLDPTRERHRRSVPIPPGLRAKIERWTTREGA